MTDYGCPICHRITCQCGPRRPSTNERINALEKRLEGIDALLARAEALEAALLHLARSDSWEIVGDAENNLEGCGLMLKGGKTPWQFARAALAAATPPAENWRCDPCDYPQGCTQAGCCLNKPRETEPCTCDPGDCGEDCGTA